MTNSLVFCSVFGEATMESDDTLVILHPEKWGDLKKVFLNDWPKHILGYYALEVQKQWTKQGLDYGFKVYCPFGNVEYGMVALNIKEGFYELIIQCNEEVTPILEEALVKTKAIDWSRKIIIAYTPNYIVKCLERAIPKIGTEIELVFPGTTYLFQKTRKPFTDLNLPKNVKIDTLLEEHVNQINDAWRYKYATSSWYFTQIIKSGTGYGLYENSELISWVSINEVGNICNMYTVDKQRCKGYAEVLMKSVCNQQLARGKDTIAYCLQGNNEVCNLYKKLQFEVLDDVAWVYIKPIFLDRETNS